jgi:hypothetical protein
LCGGGFVVTILIRLILYISYIAPWSLPLSPLPTPLKAIIRSFLVLFHIGETLTFFFFLKGLLSAMVYSCGI